MVLVNVISEELAEVIARRLRVVGDATRIRILDILRDGESSVGELVDAIGMSQQNVSKHLGVLLEAGIVGRRKDANRALYSIVDDSVFDLCETVCGSMQRQASQLEQLVKGAR